MSTQDRNIGAILDDLYASEINASISWLWDGGIDVKLGDPLSGYEAEGKASTFAEAAAWLRDQACTHYPDSEFARKYGSTSNVLPSDAAGWPPRSGDDWISAGKGEYE